MILYSLTITVEIEKVDEWLVYMKEKHIPEVLESQCFTTAHLYEAESTMGNVFRVNYSVKSKELLDRYFTDFAPSLRKDNEDRFGAYVSIDRKILHTLKQFTVQLP